MFSSQPHTAWHRADCKVTNFIANYLHSTPKTITFHTLFPHYSLTIPSLQLFTTITQEHAFGVFLMILNIVDCYQNMPKVCRYAIFQIFTHHFLVKFG